MQGNNATTSLPSAIPLLDPVDQASYPKWESAIHVVLEHSYGEPGRAIVLRRPHVLVPFPTRPTGNETTPAGRLVYGRGDSNSYDKDKITDDLSTRGEDKLGEDQKRFDQVSDRHAADDAACTRFIISTVSLNALAAIKAHKLYLEYQDASPGSRSFHLMRVLEASLKTGNMLTSLIQFKQILNFNQGLLSHEQFMAQSKQNKSIVTHQLGSKDPLKAGYLLLNLLFVALYICGLDQAFFATKIDEFFRVHPQLDEVPSVEEVMSDFQQYKVGRSIIASTSSPSALVATSPIALAANTPGAKPAPGKLVKTCDICSKFGFNPQQVYHTTVDCHKNPKSKHFSQEKLDKAVASQARRSGITAAATTSTKPTDSIVKAFLGFISNLEPTEQGAVYDQVSSQLISGCFGQDT